MLQIIECPRDAMQGLHDFIPTELKTKYINALFSVGYHTLDAGSFVSPKAIPQLQDTAEVFKNIDKGNSKTKVLAIIANERGAEAAVSNSIVDYLGYPFSISETFQHRNTNRGIAEAFEDVKRISDLCGKNNKELVVYISMGFGNPYGDAWNTGIVEQWMEQLSACNISIFSLADTVGNAHTKDIEYLFSYLIPKYPQFTIGAHFHSTADKQFEKIAAAYDNGCRRFDSAMLGFGGCPMAEDELVGNTSTDALLAYLETKQVETGLDMDKYYTARAIAQELFSKYH